MRFRLLETHDIEPCFTRWPLQGVSNHLTTRLLTPLVREDRLRGAVLEGRQEHELLGFGLSGFIREPDVVRYVEHADRSFVGALLTALSKGEQPFLNESEVSQAQGAGTMHAVVLAYRQASYLPGEAQTMELLTLGHAAFRLVLEGHRVEGVWQEAFAFDEAFLVAGGHIVKRRLEGDAEGPVAICGVRRNDVQGPWPSHTISFLFQERETRLGLSPLQRRVTSLALWHLRDREIAERLGISGDGVRQCWRGVFERVAERYPLALGPDAKLPEGVRGPEKRRHVLEFLRQNLHEVRPVPRNQRA